MNTKQKASFIFLWPLGLIAVAIVAVSPLIAFGYNQIAFMVYGNLTKPSIKVTANPTDANANVPRTNSINVIFLRIRARRTSGRAS